MGGRLMDSAYLFRFDSPLEPVVFSNELELSGWLFHRMGQPIHGLRALVRRRFAKAEIFRARRKRNRPDVVAAYPENAEAAASGFLFELKLKGGRNHFTFQVLDHERHWQTFATSSVVVRPLTFLTRLGLTNTRPFVVDFLKQRLAATPPAGNAFTTKERSEIPPSGVKRVDLFATSKSNLFIIEIGQLVAAGFRELGCEGHLHLDAVPAENPPKGTVQIVVTPHEFYNLFLTEKLSRARAQELTRHVHLLCTEQPETSWFESNLTWGQHSLAIADINPLGVAAWRRRGFPAQQLHLGYHEILSHPQPVAHPARRYDLTFLGSMTERREAFLARHADFFATRQCHLRLVPLGFAKTGATRSYLTGARRNELLSQSRILLNLHYSEQKYFEWHRMLAGLANGCCIITETCEGYGPLLPNEHFIMVEPEHLIAACEYFLSHPGECEAIARAGQRFVQTHLRQAQMCREYLHDLQLKEHEFVAPDSRALPLPDKLRVEISRHTRRAFFDASRTDLLRSRKREEPTSPVTPVAAIQRSTFIEKREGYRARFERQEEARAKGEPISESHDNALFASSAIPSLSVVVTLYNYAHHIEECVASITIAAARLAQPPELIVINDASSDESLAQALSCQASSPLPMRIVNKRFNTGLADARNLGTQTARAPFIFVMDADNLVFPEALRQLFDAVTQDNNDAAYSLLCRFRGQPQNRVGLLSYFDWDPQILVQYPYIDAMAMFRRSTLLELGGYDNQLNQIGWFGWEDYEMWLRFAQQERRVAFVPNTLCLYRHHDASMINATNLFEPDLVEHFLERYGDLLGGFEPAQTVFGAARSKAPMRFLIASGCPVATTTLYRCVHLQEQLEQLGHKAKVVDWFEETNVTPDDVLQCDVLVLYRLPMSAPLERAIEQARGANKLIIFDTDDLVFEPDLIAQQPGIAHFSERSREEHTGGARRYLQTLLACDVVTTATPFLTDLAARRGKPAFVHRNALGCEMQAWADQLHARRQACLTSDRVIIGYGSGTATHDVDFIEAASALAQVLSRFANVELWIAGPLTLPVQLQAFGERVRRFPLTDWRGWFELASCFDLALAPLEADNVFCRAKSEIKFVEAGALGLPVIASRTEPFEGVITHGQDGMLARDEKEWLEGLTLLIEQPSLRKQMGARARETVTQRYTPKARSAELKTLLTQLSAAGCN